MGTVTKTGFRILIDSREDDIWCAWCHKMILVKKKTIFGVYGVTEEEEEDRKNDNYTDTKEKQ